ncbi:MAG TPA: hypothetical protein VKY37_12070 [Brumimicrobium sp.]|nr:hypothetical protein [Brumimicrobium sp.]
MRIILLTLLITLFGSTVYSQSSIGYANNKGWFLNGNVGARFLGETSDFAEMGAGLSANGGIGYMFNKLVGIKGRMDYNNFKVTPGHGMATSNQSHSIGVSIEGVVNLLELSGNRTVRDYSLNFHGGFGFATLFNPDYRDYVRTDLDKEFADGGIKGADDMVHIVLGISPQFDLSPQFSLNLDLSHFIQFGQHNTYDTFNKTLVNGVTGVLTATAGITFRF